MASVLSSPAQAQTLNVLHTFTAQRDGSSPQGLVAVYRVGNVYGSAPYGAERGGGCSSGCGAVFRASFKNGAWTFTPIYDFMGGNDGDGPLAGVTLGPDGALYGTTLFGGGTGCNNGCGTVFKLTPGASFCRMVLCPWTETVIYRANSPTDPGILVGGVIVDNAGNVYGMSAGGGTGSGTVYKLTPAGGNNYSLSLLYTFPNVNDGANPLGNLAMDAAGNLYGTATYGGADGFGTVFKLVRSASGYTFQLLYTFTGGADGAMPQGNVVLDSAGNLYGASGEGGGIFQITPSGIFTVIDTSASFLQSPITIDAAGNIYGTTYSGGSHDAGSAFRLSYSNGTWTHTVLHSFGSGSDGALPLSGVGFDANGNLYGTTTFGGSNNGDGTLWQIVR
jgi:uncharacterized repeat protein (TIGR03803 family)